MEQYDPFNYPGSGREPTPTPTPMMPMTPDDDTGLMEKILLFLMQPIEKKKKKKKEEEEKPGIWYSPFNRDSRQEALDELEGGRPTPTPTPYVKPMKRPGYYP